MADRRGAVGEELQSSCFTCLAWHLLGHILQCQGRLSVAVTGQVLDSTLLPGALGRREVGWDVSGRAGAVSSAQDAEHLPAGASVLVTREVGLMAGISGSESERCLREKGSPVWE